MSTAITADEIWGDVKKIRANAPLVHNITNYVVMNNTANALLALGASPVMAHAIEEVTDMTAIASSLVINIGTLSHNWIEAMDMAMDAAGKRSIAIVVDPVGVGATAYRSSTCQRLLDRNRADIIRGNASEIMALVDASVKTKGVDSSIDLDPLEAARELALEQKCSVVVSGPVDLITDGKRVVRVNNGHPMMPRVTGLGCTATALIGAFAAVQKDLLLAAAHAMAVMGICGEIAAEAATGPGSLQLNLLDSLYQLDAEQLKSRLKAA